MYTLLFLNQYGDNPTNYKKRPAAEIQYHQLCIILNTHLRMAAAYFGGADLEACLKEHSHRPWCSVVHSQKPWDHS